MGAPDILARLHAAGVNLTRAGDKLIATPKAAVTPEIVDLIRAHKPELLAVIAGNPAAEARRQRVLAMLTENPGVRYALLTDLESDPEAAIVALGIRGQATCEFRIPRDKYDGLLLLDLIERHGATVH